MYIKHYLWLEENSGLANRQLRIFSDGNPGIVFCCEGHLYADASLNIPYPAVFAYGQIDSFRTIYSSGKISLLIVVLQPFALSSLLRTSAAHVMAEILQTEQFIAADYRHSIVPVVQPGNIDEKISSADNLFRTLFNLKATDSELLLEATIGFIQRLNGNISSGQLTHFTGFGERYLEKKFKEHVGMGPKKFARVTRLLHYIKSLRTGPQTNTLTQTAHQFGYFDQAHLNHDFKAWTGMTPSGYLHQPQRLALNFMTFPKA